MLEPAGADTARVLHRTLVVISFALCGLVLISFGLFARDQLAGASANQQNAIVSSTPTTPAVAPSKTHRGQPRRFIDGAAHALTSPFASIVPSSDQWVSHGIPTVFALLVYGVGLGFLARYSRGMS